MQNFSFYLSCDIDVQVRVKVGCIVGAIHKLVKSNIKKQIQKQQEENSQDPTFTSSNLDSLGMDIQAEGGIYTYGEILGLQQKSPFAKVIQEGAVWDEWIIFSVKYRDIPPNALLCLNFYGVLEGYGHFLLGGTTTRLFSRKGKLKMGFQKLDVKLFRPAESSSYYMDTYGKIPLKERSEIGRVEHLLQRYMEGNMQKVPWLDSLTFQEIENLYQEEWKQISLRSQNFDLYQVYPNQHKLDFTNGASNPQREKFNPTFFNKNEDMESVHYKITMTIEFPVFPHVVLYQQPAHMSNINAVVQQGLGLNRNEMVNNINQPIIDDPELGKENPSENKAQKLANSMKDRETIDRDLKPDAQQRDRLNQIIRSPITRQLVLEEKNLLWRFRFTLRNERRALPKFLMAVDWIIASEANQASKLMYEWAPIDTSQALELLSPQYQSPEIRQFAVNNLSKVDDKELLHYLLPLVHSLRADRQDDSPTAQLLIERAINNPSIFIHFHWYLLTEFNDKYFGERANFIYNNLAEKIKQNDKTYLWEATKQQMSVLAQLRNIVTTIQSVKPAKKSEALRELIRDQYQELQTVKFPLPFDPQITLMGLIVSECSAYKSKIAPLKLTFRAQFPLNEQDVAANSFKAIDATLSNNAGSSISNTGTNLTNIISQEAASSPFNTRSRKSMHQQNPSILQKQSSFQQQEASSFDDVQPEAKLAKISAMSNQPSQQIGKLLKSGNRQQSTGQQSSMGKFVVIYKRGDDCRQDQLVLYMFSLMDKLLKRENLDLKITAYRVMPTQPTEGIIEYINSKTLTTILNDYKSIHKYLAILNPDPKGPFGILANVLENFIRSCAGYCVLTYIMGVGDRHSENILIATDGRLFHIDFEFILGRDPKYFFPVKLDKSMVDAMGGFESKYYKDFKIYCCEAFNILRRNADLILSLFHMMALSSINRQSYRDPQQAILQVQSNLMLDVDDEFAIQYMQKLLDDAVSAIMPKLMDQTHAIAQYFR